MAKCPYTWVRGFFSSGDSKVAVPGAPAKNLMVSVIKDGEERVKVALPAHSARWLIELMPDDVVEKVRAEDIPIDAMMQDLSEQESLYPRPIFSLEEPNRRVRVWLE
jgi:hypothetical protein